MNAQIISELADAIAERLLRPEARTIRLDEFSNLYMERYAKPFKKTWKEDESRLRLHILPALGKRELLSISRMDLIELQSIVSIKGKYASNRVMEQLVTMYRLARDWGYFPEDRRLPTEGIKCFPEPSRERFADQSEIARLAASINLVRSTHMRVLFWLYLLTGLRRSEVLDAQWSDVDLERSELRVPSLRSKSGRAISQPLTPYAVQLLRSLDRRGPYIFCADGRNKPLNKSTVWRCWDRVRRRARVEDLRIHDLRRSVGSLLAQSGASLPLIGKVLNHSSQRATEIYARFSRDDVRRALEEQEPKIVRHLNRSPVDFPTGDKRLDRLQTPSLPTLAKAINDISSLKTRAFFWICLLTGLPPTVLLRARWGDLNPESQTLKVTLRSGALLLQPLPSRVLQILLELPRDTESIFALSPTSSHVYKTWDGIRRRAHLPDLKLAALRKFMDTWMVNSGYSSGLPGNVHNHHSASREILEEYAAKVNALAFSERGPNEPSSGSSLIVTYSSGGSNGKCATA